MSASYLASDVERYYLRLLQESGLTIGELCRALRAAMDDEPGWYDLARAALAKAEVKE